MGRISAQLAEGVSADPMSNVNLRRPIQIMFSVGYHQLFIQHRLAKSSAIPHKVWGQMWGADWAEAWGIEQASIPTRR